MDANSLHITSVWIGCHIECNSGECRNSSLSARLITGMLPVFASVENRSLPCVQSSISLPACPLRQYEISAHSHQMYQINGCSTICMSRKVNSLCGGHTALHICLERGRKAALSHQGGRIRAGSQHSSVLFPSGDGAGNSKPAALISSRQWDEVDQWAGARTDDLICGICNYIVGGWLRDWRR